MENYLRNNIVLIEIQNKLNEVKEVIQGKIDNLKEKIFRIYE